MKILIFTYEFPPYIGGAGVNAYNLAMGLHDIGQDVTVLTRDHELGDQEFDSSIPVLVFRAPQFINAWAEKEATLLEQVLDIGFDHVIICENSAERCASYLDWSKRTPYSIVPLGSEITKHLDFRVKRGHHRWQPRMREFYRGASHFMPISKATERILFSYLPEVEGKSRVVYPGIITDEFPKMRQAEIWEAREKTFGSYPCPVVGCIGRIGRGKGAHILVEAFSLVLKELPHTKLLLTGDGVQLEEPLGFAMELGIINSIQYFLTIAERKELYRYYGLCDIAVVPSHKEKLRVEGFGLTCLEAACCGLPVVASRTGGIPEAVLDGKTGVLVKPKDAKALADALINMLRNLALHKRYGNQGRKRVLREFTHRRMAQDIINILEDRQGA